MRNYSKQRLGLLISSLRISIAEHLKQQLKALEELDNFDLVNLDERIKELDEELLDCEIRINDLDSLWVTKGSLKQIAPLVADMEPSDTTSLSIVRSCWR